MDHTHCNRTTSQEIKEMQTASRIDKVHDQDQDQDHNNDQDQENEFNRKSPSPLSYVKFSEMGGSKFHLEVRNDVKTVLKLFSLTIL